MGKNIDMLKKVVKTRMFNKSLCDIVLACLDKAPAWLEVDAASLTGKYHPIDNLGEGGTVRHIIKTIWVGSKLVNAFNLDNDIVVAACALHDIGKRGFGDSTGSVEDYNNHPLAAAEWMMLNLETFMPEDITMEARGDIISKWLIICNAIKSHMGKWGNYQTQTEIDKIVHIADLVASMKQFVCTIKVDQDWSIL